MIVEYVRYRVPEENRHAFEEAYRAAGEFLSASKHCLQWELGHCTEEPDRFVIRIEWDSMTGHMQGLRNSAEFRQFFQHVRPYFQMIEEMQHYEVLAHAAGTQGKEIGS